MPDMNDDPLRDAAAPRSFEIVHNMNADQWELRAFGTSEPFMSADTASDLAEAAEVANLDVRLVAGQPADDSIMAAREADLANLGIKPPPVSLDPGDHVELDRLALDLDASAAVGDTPEPDLPTPESEATAQMRAAGKDWAAAYEARELVLKQLDQRYAETGHIDPDLLLQHRVADEAIEAAQKRLAAASERLVGLLGDDGPEPDDPQAKAAPDPHPRPPSGAGDAAEAEPMPEVGIALDAPEATAMPTHGIALDAPEPRPGQPGSQSHADAMAFAEAQLAPRGTPISELGNAQLEAGWEAKNAAIVAARAFPDAHAAASRTAQIPRTAARPKPPTAAKVLKRGGRR